MVDRRECSECEAVGLTTGHMCLNIANGSLRVAYVVLAPTLTMGAEPSKLQLLSFKVTSSLPLTFPVHLG